MIPYDDRHYQPPAPVATLTLRTIDGTNITVANVVALVDTGADVTLLPRWAIEQLGLQPKVDDSVQLAWFDGSTHSAESVELEVSFQGGRFQGRYALVDQPHGILGRNLLNYFRIQFDGPNKSWQRVTSS